MALALRDLPGIDRLLNDPALAPVLASYGGSTILATVVRDKPREGIDFFPMQVDYREKLTAASHKLAQAMYGQQGGGAPPPGAEQAGAPGDAEQASSDDSGDGDVIDAEFEEKN